MQQKIKLKQKGSHCNLIFHICCSQGVVCVRVQSPTTSRRRSKLPLTVSRESRSRFNNRKSNTWPSHSKFTNIKSCAGSGHSVWQQRGKLLMIIPGGIFQGFTFTYFKIDFFLSFENCKKNQTYFYDKM